MKFDRHDTSWVDPCPNAEKLEIPPDETRAVSGCLFAEQLQFATACIHFGTVTMFHSGLLP